MLLPSKSAIDFIIILVAVVNDGKMGAIFLEKPFDFGDSLMGV